MDGEQQRDSGADIRYGIGYLVIAAVAGAIYLGTSPPPGELLSGGGIRDGFHDTSAIAALITAIVGVSYLLRGLFATRRPR